MATTLDGSSAARDWSSRVAAEAKLEFGPNGFGAPYNDIATDGCVAGFLHLLKTDQSYALP